MNGSLAEMADFYLIYAAKAGDMMVELVLVIPSKFYEWIWLLLSLYNDLLFKSDFVSIAMLVFSILFNISVTKRLF